MSNIEVTLSICTLWKGVPHGLAAIEHTSSDGDDLSFRGVGVFNHGKLHNANFSCVSGESRGEGYSFTNMQNGRPADGSYFTQFNYDECYLEVKGSLSLISVSEMQMYSGQVDKEMRWNGKGKYWNHSHEWGITYVGGWKNHKRTEGKEYYLQTHTQANVKFDENGKNIERKFTDEVHMQV